MAQIIPFPGTEITKDLADAMLECAVEQDVTRFVNHRLCSNRHLADLYSNYLFRAGLAVAEKEGMGRDAIRGWLLAVATEYVDEENPN